MPKVEGLPVAAPPDDGGHLGTFTRPQDMLIRPTENEPHQAPPLQYVAPPGPDQSKGSILFALIIIGAVILALLAISSVFYGGG